MQKSKPVATGLALIFLALLLAGLAGRFWASQKAYELTGPTHIATGSEQVFLFAAGDIFQLAPTGELLAVAAPDQTGLADDPIDLGVNSDGQLLIAEQQPAAIRFCDVNSWNCRPAGFAASLVIKRQFKVLPGAEPGEFLLTDAQGDSLWKLDSHGSEPRKLVPDRTLAGPNGLAFDESGNLWVADTDHRQIIELIPSGDGTFEPGRRHSAVNSLTVGERFYPMMLARTKDNRWWVSQAADYSKPFSDLVIYDPEEGAQALVGLPDGAYATDLAVLDDSVLVTDMERFTVYRVDSETLEVSEFGDARFRERLTQIRSHRAHYDRLSDMSLAAIVLFAILMITAAVRATPKSRRWTAPPQMIDPEHAAEQVPRTNGIHWLERDPKIDRSLKWLEHLGFIGFILMAAGGLALYAFIRIQAGPDASEDVMSEINKMGLVLLAGGLFLGLTLPLVRFSTRTMKRKLGTDGKSVYIRFEDGREQVVAPSQLAYSNVWVLYRHHVLPLMAGNQRSLYAPDEVQTWLAPLLRQSRKLTQVQALKQALKIRF